MEQSENKTATVRAWSRVIALDGGTTNTRARLIQDDRVVAVARRAVGARDSVLADRPSTQRLVDAVRQVLAEVAGPGDRRGTADTESPGTDLIVAAGMLSSEVGLLPVPHVTAPAGVAELAGGVVQQVLPQVWPSPIQFVPGLRTPAEPGPDGWMRADVMRGEECETIGALSELTRKGLLEPGLDGLALVWPGSHTKLVEVDGQGRITRSQTTLAGELIQSVARHTLLAASLPGELPAEIDCDAADAGARAARDHGLARAAFLVRIAAIQEAMGPEQRASFWIGAVVADDVEHLARHPILTARRPVWIGGRDPLRTLYARWLSGVARGPVMALDDELAETASAMGALTIVLAAMDQARSYDSY